MASIHFWYKFTDAFPDFYIVDSKSVKLVSNTVIDVRPLVDSSPNFATQNNKAMKLQKIIILISIILCDSLPGTAQQTTSNSSLELKEKSIIGISALAATGDLPKLKAKLSAGLDAGLTVNEIKEALVHLYAYCGFPRSIRGLQTFMEVIEERKAKGITDKVGREASPITDHRSKYDRGKMILGELTKPPQGTLTGYSAFAPTMDTFLKEHLFADIFERDVLTYSQRELVTISVLSALGGVEPMLESHLLISLNVGWTPTQLNEFVDIIGTTVGTEQAKSAQAALNKVLKNRMK
jgi:4-carboxymuconolactone decarboxylase